MSKFKSGKKNLANWDELWGKVIDELARDNSDTLLALIKYQNDLQMWIKDHKTRIQEKKNALESKFNDHSDLYESHPKPNFQLKV